MDDGLLENLCHKSLQKSFIRLGHPAHVTLSERHAGRRHQVRAKGMASAGRNEPTTGDRRSVLLTVGGPLVYQQQRDLPRLERFS